MDNVFELSKANYNRMEYEEGYKIELFVRERDLKETLAAVQGIDAYALTYSRVQITY